MRHLDLFSGIGGFAYAVDQVFDNVEHVFYDNDKFCQQVLKKHWPESEVYGDIRSIIEPTRADILTGGFPCQPFSQAGQRKGVNDDRYLWPEMLRVIRLIKPSWVIAENVRGLLTLQGGVVFEQVYIDLEAAGYEVQPFIVPAVAVDAPHRRDRIWFVAYELSQGLEGRSKEGTGHGRQYNRNGGTERPDWSKDWTEVATELCSVDDGLPVELDGLKLSKSQNRVQQLKAYGNSIVPQVAVEIMRAIREYD